MLKRLLGYFAGGCAADESGLQQEEAFLGGLQPEGVLTRRSYAKGKISKLAEEALRFKEEQEGREGHLYGWRVHFWTLIDSLDISKNDICCYYRKA